MKALNTWLAHRSRKAIMPATTIVLHATDGASASSTINWLRQIGYSYHYIIERDGSVTKCVPTSRVAFHAGKSEGPDGSNVNEYSVGIAFANWESRNETITGAQIEAARSLVKQLQEATPSLKYLTTHYAISPGRKSDPAMLAKKDLVRIELAGRLKVWGVKVS